MAYYEKGLELTEENNWLGMRLRFYNSMGALEFGGRNIEKAEIYFKEALCIAQQKNDRNVMANAKINLGHVVIFPVISKHLFLLFFPKKYFSRSEFGTGSRTPLCKNFSRKTIKKILLKNSTPIITTWHLIKLPNYCGSKNPGFSYPKCNYCVR